MNQPAISVIIPSYNPKRHIRQCLRSVLRQTFKDMEVILVDDGSTDQREFGFLEKIARQDSRLKFVKNKHQGLSYTRKDGFLLSRGTYIFFIDNDDFLPEDVLQKLYQAAISTGADIVIGNRIRVVDSYGLIRLEEPKLPSGATGRLVTKEDILKVCYGALIRTVEDPVPQVVWGRLYRSSCVREALRADESHLFPPPQALEDYMFNLAIVPYVKLIYLTNENVYFYRHGGMTGTVEFFQKCNMNFFNYRFGQFEKWNFTEGFPRTFAAFAAMLYWRLRRPISSGKFSREEMIRLIDREVSDSKAVAWAKLNIEKINSIPDHYKLLATGSAEDVFNWYDHVLNSKWYKRHLMMKKLALGCTKVIDTVYNIFH